MSDSYQPIYDAVRSRISGGDIGGIAESVMREAFDVSHYKARLGEAIDILTNEHQRPSVLFRPTLSIDGDSWCALYGANIQEGVAGFGKSPSEAMYAFDAAWARKVGA